MRFDGSPKAHLCPEGPFSVVAESGQPKAFYNLAPGVLALAEEDWAACEEMYYVTSGGNEVLALTSGTRRFRAINPTASLPPLPATGQVYPPEGYRMPLFRIRDRNPLEVYCVGEGAGVGGDDFKRIYDDHGFMGLIFHDVWRADRAT